MDDSCNAAAPRFHAAPGTIQRLVRELGLPRIKRFRKRRARQMKVFARERPGSSCESTTGGFFTRLVPW
ncbi:MAG: hypothetical protein AUH79_07215 [Betaproteobacteria bacterium 13_1_40CM_4_64_4]|nr:MAG: hypothetical protein AUH79_07215 [Betaproteobacteria bacterium 13_1_40CM_4_64_4]